MKNNTSNKDQIIYHLITKSNEYSSDRLIDWFYFFNQKVIRLNTDDINSTKINISLKEIEYKFIIRKISYLTPIFKKNIENQSVYNYYKKEVFEYWIEVLNKFQKKIVFGSSVAKEPFRIKTLDIAKNCGFNIPDYIITSFKSKLLSFLSTYDRVITKPIIYPYSFTFNNEMWIIRATEINKKDVEKLSDEFIPTFFQKKIIKDFEVRIFYFNGNFWAIALIVSKKDEVSVDIWNNRKIREVPINIPDFMCNKIKIFMKTMNYNTGSLDFIVSNGKWFFLELNPSGEYDFVSKRGNYYLNYRIVKLLLNERNSL